ncbi:MAG: hypothetical protein R2735_07390 [Microthrixaceae bacterium]
MRLTGSTVNTLLLNSRSATKEGAGAEHIPSGHYHANAAWLACAVLAHNLGIWADLIGGTPRRTHRSRRTQLVSVPAVIVNRSRRWLLRFPTHCEMAKSFNTTSTPSEHSHTIS